MIDVTEFCYMMVGKTVFVDVISGTMWFLGALAAITVVYVWRFLWG